MVKEERERPYYLRKRMEHSWPTGRKFLFWLWNMGLLLLGGAIMGLAILSLAYGSYDIVYWWGYFASPLLALFNLLPIFALSLFFYACCGRTWLASLLTGLLVLGFALGDYYLLMFRNDPLLFQDLLLVREAGQIAGRYQLPFDIRLGISILAILSVTVGQFFLARGRAGWRGRWAGIALSLSFCIGIFALYGNDKVYARVANPDYSAPWVPTQDYISRGFLYPFIHSIADAIPSPPDNYDEEETAAVLAAYEDVDIPDDQKVNIICVMLEAFADFTPYDIEGLQPEVYANYEKLKAESYSGSLLVYTLGGGTVWTERSVLTGFIGAQSFRRQTNSYVWYFREQGYTVEGSHPYYSWFYNRVNVNQYLGFERYYYYDGYYDTFSPDNNYVYDGILFNEIIDLFKSNQQGSQPYFSFNVSFQNHGPYNYDNGLSDQYVADKGHYSAETLQMLNNYFGNIANTSQNMCYLTDYFRDIDEPTIVLFFGDHRPSMDPSSVYEDELGITMDTYATAEGFVNYYSTPYLIWANPSARETLHNDFQGEGPTINPCFLMNVLFEQCGWQGPGFMQATSEIANRLPVLYASGFYLEENDFVHDLSADGTAALNRYHNLQYYYQQNFSY